MSNRENELLTLIEQLTAGLQREVEQSQRELEQSQDERAKEARRGALGEDWRVVQSRIDNGHTSLADVFSGRDDSPEAQRLVGVSRVNLATMGEDLPDDLVEEIEAAEVQHAMIGRGGIAVVPGLPEPPLTPPVPPFDDGTTPTT